MWERTLLRSIFLWPEKDFGMPVLQAILSQMECPQAILNNNEERGGVWWWFVDTR